MKKYMTILSVLIFMQISYLQAQQNEWVWAKNAGGTSTDGGSAIVTDNNNNVYVGGFYWTSASFGSTTLSSGSSNFDMFIAKYNPGGSLLWAKNYGGPTETRTFDLTIDKQGNLLVVGTFSGTASFGDSVFQTKGNNDIFILKLDGNGNIIWSQAYGSSYPEYSPDIAVDQDNNVILGGYFSNGIEIMNYSFSSHGSQDPYVAKFSSNGSLLWANYYGCSKSEKVDGMAVDQNGNIFMTGQFTDSIAFGSFEETGVNLTDIYTVKLDPDGDPVWLKTATGNGGSYPWDIDVDKSGNVFVSGTAKDIVSFSSTVSINGNVGACDMFLAKYNNNGECLWAVDDGDGNWCQGFAVATDKLGDAYVTGFFSHHATFGTTYLSGQSQDIFIVKYNANGVFQYASSGGGFSMDFGNAIAVDDNLNPYIAGQIRDACSFGTHNLSADGTDMLIVKYGLATPPPFVITTHPQSQGICKDNQVVLHVGASVSGLDYQWMKNGNEINGATDTFLVFNNATVDEAGNYYCKVTDGSYETESEVAAVSVSDGPVIFNQTGDKNVEKGRTVNLSIQATGANLTYQWKKNGVDMNNKTSNILTLAFLEYSDSGTYTCLITDDCGEKLSAPIYVNVRRPASMEDDLEAMLQLYPNPNNGVFRLVVPDELLGAELVIYNSCGHVVYVEDNVTKEQDINISDIPESIYFISFNSPYYQLTKAFVKQ